MFYVLLVLKNFFHPYLRGGSQEKFISGKNFFVPPSPRPPPPPLGNIFGENMKKIWKNWEKYGKIGKIWHRGNFSTNVVISETGCGNFP
jgi:hypothetical protein